MKLVSNFTRSVISTFLLLAVSAISFAQDKKVDIDINTKSNDENFFMKPWVWVICAAVFILLLAAILRGGKKD